MGGDIVSWCFELDKPNNVCHTFIAIDPTKFLGEEKVADRVEDMAGILRAAPKAKGATRIYTPGEIEWTKHHVVDERASPSPPTSRLLCSSWPSFPALPCPWKRKEGKPWMY